MKPSARLTRNEAEDASKEKTAEIKTSKANRAEGGEARLGERTRAGQSWKKTVEFQAGTKDEGGKGTRAEKMEGGKDRVSKRRRKTRKLGVCEAKIKENPTNEKAVAIRAGRNKLGQKPANARRPEINDQDEAGETRTGRTKAGEVGTGRKPTKKEIEEPSSPEAGRKATGPKLGGGKNF